MSPITNVLVMLYRINLSALLPFAVFTAGLLNGAAAPLAGALPTVEPIALSFDSAQMGRNTYIAQIAQLPNGQLVAGGHRIGFFDGQRWVWIAAPPLATVRAFVPDGSKLWLASPGSIGWCELPLTSTSRLHPLDVPGLSAAGEVGCLALENGLLVATTREDVWIIDPILPSNTTKLHLATKTRVKLIRYHGDLIVDQSDAGLWKLAGRQLVPFPVPAGVRPGETWCWTDQDYILTTSHLYYRRGSVYGALADTRMLAESVISSAVRWGDRIAVGTYTKGLCLIRTGDGKISFTAASDEIPSDILSLCSDASGRLWIGSSDHGVSVAESPFIGRLWKFSAPVHGVVSVGTDVIVDYDSAADRIDAEGRESAHYPRVFSFATTNSGLAMGLRGQTWINGRIFQTGASDVDSIAEVPSGHILSATMESIYDVDPATGDVASIQSIPQDISRLVVTGDTIWAAAWNGDLLRSKARPPYAFERVANIPLTSRYDLAALNATLVGATLDLVFYGPDAHQVAGTQGLEDPRLAQAGKEVWLLGKQDGNWRVGRLINAPSGVSWAVADAKGLARMGAVTSFSADRNNLLIGDGAAALELKVAALRPASAPRAPTLRIEIGGRECGPGPVVLGLRDKLQVRPSATQALFEEPVSFEYRLLPSDDGWRASPIGEPIQLSSLVANQYVLQVRATQFGKAGDPVSFPFTALPPWYFSKLAFLAYAAGAALASYGIYLARTRQMRRRTAMLEEQVRLRTRELEEASRAKSDFLASMSHEIRNPMNGVIGLLDVLSETPGNPKQVRTLKLLRGCADQLSSTVDDILDFSRIEAGQVQLSPAPFVLKDALEAAAHIVDPSLDRVRFVEALPEYTVIADPAKVRQILVNFLGNALKYGIPPEARVSCIVSDSAAERSITLAVTNSGPTVPPETLAKYFDRFTRGEDARMRNIRGTGLGLAICKRYAEAMGGSVGATSANGETTFYARLPVVFPAAPVSSPTPAQTSPLLPARALAIEDEEYNRIALGHILSKLNYTVDWATNGAEATALARSNSYDLVLTDYRLPDTTGVALCRELLATVPDPKPAVFAVTAYSTKERKAECLAAGMAGFISKPISLQKLTAALSAWGAQRRTTMSLEVTLPDEPPPAVDPAPVLEGWAEVRRACDADRLNAAQLAHRLNNLCRIYRLTEVGDQLELLEGALERGEPVTPLIGAIERLLRQLCSSSIVVNPALRA